MEIYWEGTEEQQHAERMKACRARRAAYDYVDCERDGSCEDCELDMAVTLRVATPIDSAERGGGA